MSIDFKIGFARNYTTTLTGTPGVTTDGPILGGSRQIIPTPTPTDANAIWIAPNGNDANPGTSGAPVLTIPAAHALMGGAFTTMHFFRNGSGSPMTFAASSNLTFSTGWNMQCEYGEIVTLNFSADATYTFNGTNHVNGFNVYEATRSVSGSPMNVNGADCKFKSCYFDAFVNAIDNNATIGQYLDLVSCFFYGKGILVNSHTSQRIANCAFVQKFADTGAGAAIVWNQSEVAAQTNTVERCLFVGYNEIGQFWDKAANFDTVDFDGCAFELCNHVGSASGAASNEVNVNLDYCHNRTIRDNIRTLTAGNATINFTEDNAADPDKAPLYVDLDDSRLNGTQDGTRLRWQGKATGTGGKYFLTSPLVGHYTPPLLNKDVNPWNETTVLSSQTFAETVSIVWPPGAMTKTFRPVNAVSITDVVGDPHTGVDAVKRVFNFAFGSGNEYANNNDLRKLVRILAETGTIRMYPSGISGNLFLDPTTCLPDATQGTFDSTDNSVAPVILSGFPMIPRNWQGLIVELDGQPYYVASNDTAKMYLKDVFSVGFPGSGLKTFTVNSILVRPNVQDLAATQEMFTKFFEGGSFRETSQAYDPDTTLAFELKGYSIELFETSGLDEGV